MTKCFLLSAVPFGGSNYTRKACGNTSSLKPRYSSQHGNGFYWDVDGVDMFNGSIIKSGSISVVSADTPSTYGSCSGCENVVIKYDCINAVCTQSSQYNTPGIYTSLSQCETACGTGCSGQCISNEEWSKINSLANQLLNKNC